MQVRNAIIIHSLDISKKNTDSQAAMAQSTEHATSTQEVTGSILGHSLLFGQNLRNLCESWMDKKPEACDITLAGAN